MSQYNKLGNNYNGAIRPNPNTINKNHSNNNTNNNYIHSRFTNPSSLQDIKVPELTFLKKGWIEEHCLDVDDKELKQVAVHDGFMHADEVFSIAALKVIYDVDLVRTREKSLINLADIVLDVDDVYDHSKFRYDHHNPNFNVRHKTPKNIFPYGPKRAAFGLIWLHYGCEICARVWNEKYRNLGTLTEETINEAAEYIDRSLVTNIDVIDNGEQNLYTSYFTYFMPGTIAKTISLFNPLYVDDNTDEVMMKRFNLAVDMASCILKNHICSAVTSITAGEYVRERLAEVGEKDTYLLLEKPVPYAYHFTKVASKYPCIGAVIMQVAPRKWNITFIKFNPRDRQYYSMYLKNKNARTYRFELPKDVLGKRDEVLSGVCGIPDMIFCHSSGFMAVAASKEAAIAFVEWASVVSE
jgi:uncharacterized UPF0160 family protein